LMSFSIIDNAITRDDLPMHWLAFGRNNISQSHAATM